MADLAQQLEAEAMADMFNKMVDSCHYKCIAQNYKEAEMNKAESVCVDRCSLKYMEMHDDVGRLIAEKSKENEEKLMLEKK